MDELVRPQDYWEVALSVGLIISVLAAIYLSRLEERHAQPASPIKSPPLQLIYDQLSCTIPGESLKEQANNVMKDKVTRDHQNYDNVFYHHLRSGIWESPSPSMLDFLHKRNNKSDRLDDEIDGMYWL